MSGYAMAKGTSYNLQVYKNSTVRGIKQVTNFLHQLHEEENLQNRVFGVENNLGKILSLRKRPLQFL